MSEKYTESLPVQLVVEYSEGSKYRSERGGWIDLLVLGDYSIKAVANLSNPDETPTLIITERKAK